VASMTKSTDGPVSRYINRKISTKMTNFIVRHRIPLTPNQVSVISFLIGVAGSILFIPGHLILAGILIQISSIVDGVDGELARALKMQSRFGAFFDAMLDRYVDILTVTCMSIYFLKSIPSPGMLEILISIAAITGTLMVSYTHARGEASLRKHPLFIGKVPSFASRDVRLFLIFVGAVLGAFWGIFIWGTLVLLAVVTNLYVMAKFIDVAVHRYMIEEEPRKLP